MDLDHDTILPFETHGTLYMCPQTWDQASRTRATTACPANHGTESPSTQPSLPANVFSSEPYIQYSPLISNTEMHNTLFTPIRTTILSVPSTPPSPTTCTLPSSRTLNLESPPPTPPPSYGPPKQTCFFWYHGECGRGSNCHFQHEAHTTWPINPLPGYVHRRPCYLPLCPVKEGMSELRKGIADEKRINYIDDPVKRAAGDTLRMIDHVHKSKVASEYTDGSDVDDRSSDTAGSDDDIVVSDADSEDDEEKAGLPAVITLSTASFTVISSSSSDARQSPSLVSSPPLVIYGQQNFDEEEDEITTISHAGTLNRRPFRPQATTIKKTTHAYVAGQSLASPQKATTALKQEICFYWYHSGRCSHQNTSCSYLHKLDNPIIRVQLPNLRKPHRQNCPLPRCPVRLLRTNQQDTHFVMATEHHVEAEGPYTTIKAKGSDDRTVANPAILQKSNKRPRRRSYGQKRSTKRIRLQRKAPMEEDEPAQKELRVLVDYELPEGKDRADWDTDFVRRAFGEIE